MLKISNQELMNIRGGAITWKTLSLIVGGVITFVIGFIDGFKRPLKCNKWVCLKKKNF